MARVILFNTTSRLIVLEVVQMQQQGRVINNDWKWLKTFDIMIFAWSMPKDKYYYWAAKKSWQKMWQLQRSNSKKVRFMWQLWAVTFSRSMQLLKLQKQKLFQNYDYFHMLISQTDSRHVLKYGKTTWAHCQVPPTKAQKRWARHAFFWEVEEDSKTASELLKGESISWEEGPTMFEKVKLEHTMKLYFLPLLIRSNFIQT